MNRPAEIFRLRGLAWALADELARRELASANAVRENPRDWPAGQKWDELAGSSQSIFRRRGYEAARLDADSIVALLCDNGSPKPYDELSTRDPARLATGAHEPAEASDAGVSPPAVEHLR